MGSIRNESHGSVSFPDRLDFLAMSLLGVAALGLYVRTLAPGPLTGDPGELQYMPFALGIPHPTGYPLYVLVGRLWTLVPWASVAYQMNLLSAMLAAATLVLLYAAARCALGGRLPALFVAGALAVSPTFWSYSLFAALYGLNTCVLALILLLLFLWEQRRDERLLWVMAAAWGFGLGNHSTLLLAAPAFALFVVLVDPRLVISPRRLVPLLATFVAALALVYAYIPLRGQALLSGELLAGQPKEIYTGLVTPYFAGSGQGFWNLVLATSFASDFSFDWGNVAVIGRYWDLIRGEFGPVLLLAPLGAVSLAYRQRRLAIALTAGYVISVALLLRVTGPLHFPAYGLPASLLLCLIMAAGAATVADLLGRWLGQRLANGLMACLLVGLVLVGVGSRLPAIDQSQATSVEQSWQQILDSPLEPGAGLMAHWGDLTPLWYYQQTQKRRPDLVGLFPPTIDLADEWLKQGRPLYLSGPLLGWGEEIPRRYRLVSWGDFVRVMPPGQRAGLSGAKPVRASFDERLLLSSAQVDVAVEAGSPLHVALQWESLCQLEPDHAVSLRLADAYGRILLQRDQPLVSQQYPGTLLMPGEEAISIFGLPVPSHTAPGPCVLQVVVYRPASGRELPMADGTGTVLTVATVTLLP